ncbi:MAG TPA: DUF4905 domain-containing protein [Cytophagaceae bacterium]|jgi:hypothetical protein
MALNFFNRQKATAVQSIRFGEGNIWKIIIESTLSTLFIETREPEKRQVKFHAVDLKNKKAIWEYTDTEERWWLGLEDALPNAVLIHGYRNPKFPDHKGLIALDPVRGKILWKNPNWTFINKSGSAVLVSTEKEDTVLLLDPKNGTVHQEMSAPEAPAPSEAASPKVMTGQAISTDNGTYEKIKSLVVERTQLHLIEEINYLEHNGHIIISFYVLDHISNDVTKAVANPGQDSNNNVLTHMLWILDKDGNQKILNTLGKNLKGISSDPFFVFDNMVIFLADKNELMIYGLE